MTNQTALLNAIASLKSGKRAIREELTKTNSPEVRESLKKLLAKHNRKIQGLRSLLPNYYDDIGNQTDES